MPNPAVIAIHVRNTLEKEMSFDAQPTKFFTEPHYNGFPAILVRLAAVEADELEALLLNAWRCQAPPALVKDFDQQQRGVTLSVPKKTKPARAII